MCSHMHKLTFDLLSDQHFKLCMSQKKCIYTLVMCNEIKLSVRSVQISLCCSFTHLARKLCCFLAKLGSDFNWTLSKALVWVKVPWFQQINSLKLNHLARNCLETWVLNPNPQCRIPEYELIQTKAKTKIFMKPRKSETPTFLAVLQSNLQKTTEKTKHNQKKKLNRWKM